MSASTDSLIDGPAGKLQLRVMAPEGAPRAIAVVCHPHPLHGGTLDNKVVHQLAKSFVALDAVAVRFNFRGVGRSEGKYDEGRGEKADLLAVVEWAGQRWPGVPVWLAGFSFGGFVALDAAQSLRPAWLVTVAPAVNYFPSQAVSLAGIRWLMIQGDADDIVPLAEVESWLERQGLDPQMVRVEGAGHFFHGRLNELRDSVLRAASSR